MTNTMSLQELVDNNNVKKGGKRKLDQVMERKFK